MSERIAGAQQRPSGIVAHRCGCGNRVDVVDIPARDVGKVATPDHEIRVVVSGVLNGGCCRA